MTGRSSNCPSGTKRRSRAIPAPIPTTITEVDACSANVPRRPRRATHSSNLDSPSAMPRSHSRAAGPSAPASKLGLHRGAHVPRPRGQLASGTPRHAQLLKLRAVHSLQEILTGITSRQQARSRVVTDRRGSRTGSSGNLSHAAVGLAAGRQQRPYIRRQRRPANSDPPVRTAAVANVAKSREPTGSCIEPWSYAATSAGTKDAPAAVSRRSITRTRRGTSTPARVDDASPATRHAQSPRSSPSAGPVSSPGIRVLVITDRNAARTVVGGTARPSPNAASARPSGWRPRRACRASHSTSWYAPQLAPMPCRALAPAIAGRGP